MLDKRESDTQNVVAIMAEVGRKARAAARPLALASAERKYAALIGMAEAVRQNMKSIIEANAIDIDSGESAGLSPALHVCLCHSEIGITVFVDGTVAL